jgi:hypothetical protein
MEGVADGSAIAMEFCAVQIARPAGLALDLPRATGWVRTVSEVVLQTPCGVLSLMAEDRVVWICVGREAVV